MRNKLASPALHKQILLPFKKAAQRLPTARDAIVVASFGRAGSTLVNDALAKGMAQARVGTTSFAAQKIVRDDAFDLSAQPLLPGVIYKTHDYPEVLAGAKKVRAIFLFGSAVDAALSVYTQKMARSEDWVRLHFEHLRRPYRYEALLHEDVLGFRDQCVSWMGCGQIPVLCMRYEGLWDNEKTLSEFCGFKVRLPERRPRGEKKIAPELLAAAQAAYGQLDEDMAQLPDCFVASPEFGQKMTSGSIEEVRK